MDFITDHVLLVGNLNSRWIIASTLVCVTLYFWPIWRRRQFPHGPLPLPFVGNALWWFSTANVVKKLADEYGELATVYLQTPTVFLNSKEAIYDAFVKNADHLSQRPDDLNPVYQLTKGKGVINEEDGKWQTLRRHLLSVFKEHGVGKSGMEEKIKVELKYFTESLVTTGQRPIDMTDMFVQAVSNVATNIIFGNRFDYDEEQLNNLQFDKFLQLAITNMLVPFLRFLPWDVIGYYEARKKAEVGLNFARKQIADHKKDLDVNNPRDFIDSFLIEMNEKADDAFSESNLIAEVMQLYIAGTDTTSTSLYWAVLYLVLQPETQERIYKEIRDNIGENAANYADRNNMHFTMSFITEVFRQGSAFMSLPHLTKKDLVIRGYCIPKGTTVHANIWAVLHDKSLYQEPEMFQADRFLDVNGKFTKPDSKFFVPFSIGRRVCPGEPLARMEMFLFIVAMIQNFKIELGQASKPSTDVQRKFLFKPQRYFVQFIPRT